MEEDQANQSLLPSEDMEKDTAFGTSEASDTEDEKVPVTNGKLCFKIKIPKSGNGSGEENSVHDDQKPIESEFPRICNVCNKGFSSGKALGGHMRIHFQANKHLNKKTQNPKIKKQLADLPDTPRSSDCNTGIEGSPTNETEITCKLCGKSFPSMKSLFGHMRCHPERRWRGIQPPPTAKNSSSSTVSDAVVARQVDDHNDSATTGIGSVVDLSQSLSGWSMTGRRGRKSTASGSGVSTGTASRSNSASEEQIPILAADSLLMLSKGDESALNLGLSYMQRFDACEAKNGILSMNMKGTERRNHLSERLGPSNKRRIGKSSVGYGRNSTAKKLKVGNSSEIALKETGKDKGKAALESESRPVIMNSGWETREIDTEDSESKDTDVSIPGELLIQSFKISKKTMKKRRRKMKLRDLEAVGDVYVAAPVDKSNPVTPDRYKCTTCNKSFPTHQALGGHRSSHNKVKNNQAMIMDESEYAPDTSATENENEHYAINAAARVGEAEEYEEGCSSQLGASPHQCKICNKTFATGQALGGHKRCHWTGPIEAPSSQVASSEASASQTGRKFLAFDLNQLPAMEDEEGIESAFARPQMQLLLDLVIQSTS